MNMFTKATSLIIPTRNRPEHLFNILNQLRLFKLSFSEILVIDSSDNNKKKIIKKISKKFNTILFNSKPSSSLQRNIGLKKRNFKNKFVMFLDDDVIFFNNSFYEMNKTINKYKNNTYIVGFGFNQVNNNKNTLIEKIKKNKFFENINLYSSIPGKVTKSGWHTKILNLKKDVLADWVFTTASVFKSNSIKGAAFDLTFGNYSYLEDLDFSLNVTNFSKKIILSHSSKFTHPLNIDRSDFNFGKIEIINRYKIVNKYNLVKKLFFLNVFLRFIFSFLNIFLLNFNSFKRAIGNIYGLLIIFLNFK